MTTPLKHYYHNNLSYYHAPSLNTFLTPLSTIAYISDCQVADVMVHLMNPDFPWHPSRERPLVDEDIHPLEIALHVSEVVEVLNRLNPDAVTVVSTHLVDSFKNVRDSAIIERRTSANS